MPLKFANNQSLTSVTALPSSVPTDNLILISTQTASNSSSIEFTSGLNSTYDVYIFKLINIQPTTDNNSFFINFSTDGGSNYNVTKTSTFFKAQHTEDDSVTELAYDDRYDQAQGTGNQHLFVGEGNGSDENSCSEIYLFNPSSTTYVKHFLITSNYFNTNNYSINSFTGGYCNTTSAVNAVKFLKDTGNFNGIIKLYGVKKS
jgi:hypothetical protein